VAGSTTLTGHLRDEARLVQLDPGPCGVTQLAVGFGESVLVARRPAGRAGGRGLRQAWHQLTQTAPRRPAGPELAFSPVAADSLSPVLGVAVLHRGPTSTTVYYAGTDCDAGLAHALAQALAWFPGPCAGGYRFERVDAGVMPALVPLIVTAEDAGITAYCRQDLLTGRLARTLEVLLSAWPARRLAPVRAAVPAGAVPLQRGRGAAVRPPRLSACRA
jgi:hypothetical protein